MKLRYLIASFGLILAVGTILVNCEENEEKSTFVELDGNGKLEGISLTSRKGRKYSGFLGVPYGKVPLRFAAPEPAEGWSEVKKVQTLPAPCFHFCSFTKQIVGEEHCLHLNVYTPSTKKGAKMPVFVWLSPGGFNLGGASMVEAKYLMDEDVVFVTLNYRLGAMGFLNFQDGVVSGNNGLKDQTLALQWVQKHIEKFGGDKNLVTLFGMSAGGASVQYHLLSPMSKGLINRGIAFSGSVLNPWALQNHPKEISNEFAEHANCAKETTQETVNCLQKKEPRAILNAQNKLSKFPSEFDFISMKFVPSIESGNGKGPKFLTESPYELLKRGEIANKVPLIAGYSENEGSFFIANIMKDAKSIELLNKEWNKIAPNMLYYEDVTLSSQVDSVSKKIYDFYFPKGKKIGEETKRNLANVFTDRFFTNGIAKGIKLQAVHQPVYPYITTYQGKHSLIQFGFGVKDRFGVGHADEMMYLFNKTVMTPEIELHTDDGKFSEEFIKMIVTFAKTGKPTEGLGKKWIPVEVKNKEEPEKTKLKYLELDLDPEMVDDPLKARRHFWSQLPLKEHQNVNLADHKDEL